MKAIVCRRYGAPDVLTCEEVEKPAPADDEVLIKVRAAGSNPLDYHLMKGKPAIGRLAFGLRRPRNDRPGVDVAGVVETIGAKVAGFKPGDEVFGGCRGAFAEYACASESAVVVKPANVAFEQAAAAPVAGYTALQGLRDKGKLQPGQTVLVNGAAGGVGTFAVQLARWMGAHVTGVCSTRNVELVRSLGADRIVDYAGEDFTRGKEHYDVIFDLVANHSLSACRRILNPNGIYLGVGILALHAALWALLPRFAGAAVLSRFGRRKFITVMANRRKEDLTTLAELMASGKLTAVIDRRYALEEVPDALRYLQEGHARGKVVIAVQQAG